MSELKVSQIRTDGGTQMRERLSEVTVATYADHMRDGTEFPPVVVFYDGANYWLADGFHRVAAYKQAEIENATVDTRAGERLDAVRFALSANSANGQRRSEGDMRRAYNVAVDSKLCDPASTNEVRELLKCSHGWAVTLTKPARDKAKAERDAEILRLHNEGMTQREVASEVGVGVATVNRVTVPKSHSDFSEQRVKASDPQCKPVAAASKPAPQAHQEPVKPVHAEQSAHPAIEPFNGKFEAAERIEREVEKVYVSPLQEAMKKDLRHQEAEIREVKRAVVQAKKEAFKANIDKQIADIEQATPTAPQGLFNVIAIDPPWNYGREYDPLGSRIANPYPEMTQAQLLEMDIPSDDDCVMFLWTTHQFIFDAKELLDKWGFTYKATMVWDKERMGMGAWLRMQCEFVLVGIKGKPYWENTTHRDMLREPRREHSRKPDSFYKMVTEVTHGRRIEMFSRQQRDGWEVYGNDTDKF